MKVNKTKKIKEKEYLIQHQCFYNIYDYFDKIGVNVEYVTTRNRKADYIIFRTSYSEISKSRNFKSALFKAFRYFKNYEKTVYKKFGWVL